MNENGYVTAGGVVTGAEAPEQGGYVLSGGYAIGGVILPSG